MCPLAKWRQGDKEKHEERLGSAMRTGNHRNHHAVNKMPNQDLNFTNEVLIKKKK